MIDSIGLTELLTNIGVLIALVGFILVTLLTRFLFERSWWISVLIGLLFCIGGFFSAPYIFSFVMHLFGYSYIGA